MSSLKYLKLLLEYKLRFKKGYLNTFKSTVFSKKTVTSVKLPYFSHPILLRRNTSDRQVFNQVFLNEEYKLSKKINNNKIEYIIDCGANIGLSALYFSYVYPSAKIVAVELEKNNYELLLKNVSGVKNIYPLHAGIWNKKTTLKIADENADSWAFSAESSTENNVNTLQGLAITDVMEQFNFPRIDLLKIDIEGGEYGLFEENADSFLSKTRILVAEIHDWLVPGCSKVFFAALKKYNYMMVSNGENIFCEIKNEVNK